MPQEPESVVPADWLLALIERSPCRRELLPAAGDEPLLVVVDWDEPLLVVVDWDEVLSEPLSPELEPVDSPDPVSLGDCPAPPESGPLLLGAEPLGLWPGPWLRLSLGPWPGWPDPPWPGAAAGGWAPPLGG